MSGTVQIGMLLLPACNSMAAQAFLDPFRAVNYLRGENLYDWTFLSLDGEPVRASNGLLIGDTVTFSDVEQPLDFLVVNSSWTPERFRDRSLQKWLHRLEKRGTTLVGIDTGAFVLAFAGLMDGYRAVVHYEHMDAFRELFPASPLEDALFVLDRNRISCCGGLAAADLALNIIHSQMGIGLANAVAQYIFLENLRHTDQPQHSRRHNPVGQAVPEQLQEVIVLMERNLEEPLSLEELAHYSSLSQRQLQRLFRRFTGVTPVRYYINLRLSRGHSLLTQTEFSVAEIAGACGFRSAEQFSRAYKAYFGIAPSLDRQKGRIPFQFRSHPGYLGG